MPFLYILQTVLLVDGDLGVNGLPAAAHASVALGTDIASATHRLRNTVQNFARLVTELSQWFFVISLNSSELRGT